MVDNEVEQALRLGSESALASLQNMDEMVEELSALLNRPIEEWDRGHGFSFLRILNS
jgi:hypothetical protein